MSLKKDAVGMMLISTGNFFAQLLAFIAVPLLTRLYEPEDFAALGLFLALATVLSVAATLRYENATLFVPYKKAQLVFNFTMKILSIWPISACFMAAVCLYLVARGGLSYEQTYMFFIPFSVYVLAVSELSITFLTRLEKYAEIVNAKIIRAITLIGFQIAASLFNLGSLGLIIGALFGQFAGYLYVVRTRSCYIATPKSLKLSKREMTVAKEYSEFPKYSLPQALVQHLSEYMPLLFFSFVAAPTITGLYVISERLMRIPSKIFSQSVRQVLIKRWGAIAPEKVANEIFWATLLLLFCGSIFFAVLVSLSPQFLLQLLSGGWEGLKPFLVLTYLWALSEVLAAPSSAYLIQARKQKWLFKVSSLYFVFRGLALVSGMIISGHILALHLFVAMAVFFNTMIILQSYIWARRNILN